MKKNISRASIIALAIFILIAIIKSIINIYVGAYSLGIGEIALSAIAFAYILEILKAYEK